MVVDPATPPCPMLDNASRGTWKGGEEGAPAAWLREDDEDTCTAIAEADNAEGAALMALLWRRRSAADISAGSRSSSAVLPLAKADVVGEMVAGGREIVVESPGVASAASACGTCPRRAAVDRLERCRMRKDADIAP